MYYAGNWSRLQSSFGFIRRSGYFLIQIYAPCGLTVMLSWISFCIPRDATAARTVLGITSVLTITTILNMLNTAMPKVSYVKAIDWYLIVSFVFVVGVLVEYTFVLYVANVHNKRLKRSMIEQEIQEAEEDHQISRPAMNGYIPRKYRHNSHDYDHDSPIIPESYFTFSNKSKHPAHIFAKDQS
ncbi:hypothetical protein OS493_028278 [Desmophyllum pertusum]|uniref:Neurotransmitter-gated ion-channel transmembrane domain-containing protein n=1 Tax=Desmophyllum pertusum TaxID=174260 RepID=A0A9X0CID2_9CNID|nr:hypothetical protein OS493_028278 [Desmophyllum pertusum]